MTNRPRAAITRKTPIPAMIAFSVMFIVLGVWLYVGGANVVLILLATGMGLILLLNALLGCRVSRRARLFTFLILIIVLAPPLPPFWGTVSWRIYQILLLVLTPFIVYWRRHMSTRVDVRIAVLGSFMTISMLIGFISGNPPLLRDWFELAKPGFWWLIFSLSLGLRWRLELRERALWIFLGLGALSSLLSLMQYLNWGDVNRVLSPLYVVNQAQLRNIGIRVSGTFISPAQQATFLTSALSVAVVLLLFSRRKRWLRCALFIYACGTFIAILMTASKYGLFASILTVSGIVLLHFWTNWKSLPGKVLMTAILVLVVIVASVFLVTQANSIRATSTAVEVGLRGNPFEATLYRLGGIEGDLDPNATRLSNWRMGWKLGMQAPIFGEGPSKDVDMNTYLHSEYLLVFRRYGFAGLAAFLILYGDIVFSAYRSFRQAQIRQDMQQRTMALSTLVFVMIFAIDGVFSNGAMSDFQLSAVLWWVIGLFYGVIVAPKVPSKHVGNSRFAYSLRSSGNSAMQYEKGRSLTMPTRSLRRLL